MRKYNRDAWRAEKKRLVDAGDPSVPHGTHTAYANWGCRCKACYVAWLKTKAQRYLDLT